MKLGSCQHMSQEWGGCEVIDTAGKVESWNVESWM